MAATFLPTAFHRLILATALTSAIGAGAAFAKVADNPDGDFLRVLHSRLSGAAPNFEDEAKKSAAYINADEFSRADVLKEQADLLRQAYQDVAEYDQLSLRVRAELGDWDADRGAFPITLFMPGTYIDMRTSKGGYAPGVTFSNAAEARYWAMPVDQARGIAEAVGDRRDIELVVEMGELHISAQNSQLVTGEVHKVTVMTPDNIEVGSYAPEPARVADAGADQSGIAQRMPELLDVPQLGSDLDTALEWAAASFEGVAWSVQKFSGPVEYEGSDEWPYNNFVPNADLVRVSFSHSTDSAKGALRHAGFDRNKSDAGSAFGENLDCNSADVLDRCGIMLFEKQDGGHRLVELVVLTEVAEGDYKSLIPALVGDDLAAFEYDEDTPHSYGQGELYYLGAREAGGMRSVNFREQFRDIYSAPVMLYSFPADEGRSVSISRISALPDGSNVTGQ